MIYCIGLLANAGHGKTTVARYLSERYDTRTVSLAGPLKRAAKAVMDFSDEQLYGTQEQKEAIDPRYGFSARYFLRRLGTEGLRDEFWPEVHLEAFRKSLERQAAAVTHDLLFVCDDVRFPNEAQMISVRGGGFFGTVLKIVCTDAPVVESSHASEAVDSVPEHFITATVTSSRAQGMDHLTREVDCALRRSVLITGLLEDGYRRLHKAA